MKIVKNPEVKKRGRPSKTIYTKVRGINSSSLDTEKPKTINVKIDMEKNPEISSTKIVSVKNENSTNKSLDIIDEIIFKDENGNIIKFSLTKKNEDTRYLSLKIYIGDEEIRPVTLQNINMAKQYLKYLRSLLK